MTDRIDLNDPRLTAEQGTPVMVPRQLDHKQWCDKYCSHRYGGCQAPVHCSGFEYNPVVFFLDPPPPGRPAMPDWMRKRLPEPPAE